MFPRIEPEIFGENSKEVRKESDRICVRFRSPGVKKYRGELERGNKWDETRIYIYT